MYTVDLYLRVRLACHGDGLSQREAASRFGLARATVRKMLRHSEPPGYRRRQPPKRPKLAPFTRREPRRAQRSYTTRRDTIGSLRNLGKLSMATLRNFNGLASWRNAENSPQSANVTMPS